MINSIRNDLEEVRIMRGISLPIEVDSHDYKFD
jgi:hypothetical protein